MYKLKIFTSLPILIFGLTACGGNSSSDSSPQGSGEVTYRLTFNANWNANDFPTNFPSDPHFSPIIGATHNNQDFLWRTDEPSTSGIEQVAETGGTGIYTSELEEKKAEGNVDNIFKGSRIDSPASSSLEFNVNASHPYISAISMIAPSPDWFVGIRDINLYENNAWIENLSLDLKLYDAGTDTGAQFNSADSDGGSGIITLLTSAVIDSDFNEGIHRTSGQYLGQFILERVDTSDAN